MTEAEEPTGLVQEFIQTIKDGAARLTTYRDACTKFTDDTRQHAGELKALIDRLEDCIRQIEALQEEVAKSHTFTVTNHKMELYGRCKDCN